MGSLLENDRHAFQSHRFNTVREGSRRSIIHGTLQSPMTQIDMVARSFVDFIYFTPIPLHGSR